MQPAFKEIWSCRLSAEVVMAVGFTKKSNKKGTISADIVDFC